MHGQNRGGFGAGPVCCVCLANAPGRDRSQPSGSCESTQRIEEANKERHPEIDWTSIVGMRNVLVHDYFEVDFVTVWDVVARDLPPLVKAIHAILAALD